MAQSALDIVQASVTKTAAFSSAAFDMGGGIFPRVAVLKVNYSAANTSSGAGTAVFVITGCATSGGTYVTIAGDTLANLVLSTTAAAGVIRIPFTTEVEFIKGRLDSITGTGATITYDMEIELAIP